MSLNFELPEDLIHNDTMEISENLIFSDELYDLGLEAYEPNEFMSKAVQDLKLFFNDKLNEPKMQYVLKKLALKIS